MNTLALEYSDFLKQCLFYAHLKIEVVCLVKSTNSRGFIESVSPWAMVWSARY
jgi:hypothetical protein